MMWTKLLDSPFFEKQLVASALQLVATGSLTLYTFLAMAEFVHVLQTAASNLMGSQQVWNNITWKTVQKPPRAWQKDVNKI